MALPLLGLTLTACHSHFEEQHYFASAVSVEAGESLDLEESLLSRNFFRVTVEGHVDLQDARFLSGYFDPQAVDAYFGQFSQPKGGNLQPTPATTEESVQPLGGNPNSKLVLLLSSNSDAIAKGISNMAQGTELASSLALLAGGERLRERDEANASLAREQSLARRDLALAEAFIDSLKPDSDPTEPQVKDAFLGYVNAIAARHGGGPFEELSAAKDWFGSTRPFDQK